MSPELKRPTVPLDDPLAETWATQALLKGAEIDSILLRSHGQHARSQRADIIGISGMHIAEEDVDLTVIDSRRDGIYDNLPEALFHEAGSSRTSKRNKSEDQHAATARVFFQPFEQEPFRLRSAMRSDEISVALGGGDRKRQDALSYTWDLPEDLDARTRAALLRVLPWLGQSVCDLHISSVCYTFVTGHPVSITLDLPGERPSDPAMQAVLGKAVIGDMVVGSSFQDGWPVIHVAMTGVPLAKLAEPTQRRTLRRNLEVLSNYLLPVHLDVRYSIAVRKEDEGLTLGDPLRPGILALNTSL